MKRFAFTAVCAVVALCGCMKDIEVSPSVETHYITFKADASATKTSMVYDGEKGAYTMIWEVRDQIAVFEYAEGFDFPVKYLSKPLEAGDISNGGQTADFKVSVTDAAGSDFSYVAVYPAFFLESMNLYANIWIWIKEMITGVMNGNMKVLLQVPTCC